MEINVNIQLDEGETLAKTADQLADGILKAAGGTLADDFCRVTVMQKMPVPGEAGTPALPPPPPEGP